MTALRVFAAITGAYLMIAFGMSLPKVASARSRRERRRYAIAAGLVGLTAFFGLWLALFGRVVP